MIERAPFGVTGRNSSRAIFGAAALGKVSTGDADRTLSLLLEHGINHIDVAASYGDAELRTSRRTGCSDATTSRHASRRHWLCHPLTSSIVAANLSSATRNRGRGR